MKDEGFFRYVPRRVCPHINLTPKQAEEIGKELADLAGSQSNEAIDSLKPRVIVEAAKHKSSAMHAVLWGPTKIWIEDFGRLQLARNLKQSIRIEFATPKGISDQVQPLIYVSPAPKRPPGYVPVEKVMDSPYMRGDVAKRATHRLNQWLDEFRAFKHTPELKPIWSGVRLLLQEHKALDDEELRVARKRR